MEIRYVSADVTAEILWIVQDHVRIPERSDYLAIRTRVNKFVERTMKELWYDGYTAAVAALAERESCSPAKHSNHRPSWQREDGSCLFCPREDVPTGPGWESGRDDPATQEDREQ